MNINTKPFSISFFIKKMKDEAGVSVEESITESCLEITVWNRRELGIQTGKCFNTVYTSVLGYESLF